MHHFLIANQLSVSISDTQILDGLSFQLPAGRLIGIIGPNGSGKTTLLRTISGILPYEGELLFDGQQVAGIDRKKLARQLAVLPQNPDIGFEFTVRDYVMLGRTPHKRWLEGENGDDRARVTAVLDALDLAGLAARTLPSLSGGERQRVLLAQALVQDTPALLLDEPTSHLDVYHQFDLLKRVRQLVDGGKTIVIVFHDLGLAARFTDDLLVLQAGRLAVSGSTREVLTADCIRSVFRMDATVHHPDNQPPQIHFIDQS